MLIRMIDVLYFLEVANIRMIDATLDLVFNQLALHKTKTTYSYRNLLLALHR